MKIINLQMNTIISDTDQLYRCMCMYIYIHMCVCVCVCIHSQKILQLKQ